MEFKTQDDRYGRHAMPGVEGRTVDVMNLVANANIQPTRFDAAYVGKHRDDSGFEDYIDRRIADHELWLASAGADHLFEGRGE